MIYGKWACPNESMMKAFANLNCRLFFFFSFLGGFTACPQVDTVIKWYDTGHTMIVCILEFHLAPLCVSCDLKHLASEPNT